MPENLEKNIDIMVVKRDGKKVPFDGAKIALAIKKGFDSVYTEDEETHKYIDKDMYKIYNKVIEKIISRCDLKSALKSGICPTILILGQCRFIRRISCEMVAQKQNNGYDCGNSKMFPISFISHVYKSKKHV